MQDTCKNSGRKCKMVLPGYTHVKVKGCEVKAILCMCIRYIIMSFIRKCQCNESQPRLLSLNKRCHHFAIERVKTCVALTGMWQCYHITGYLHKVQIFTNTELLPKQKFS